MEKELNLNHSQYSKKKLKVLYVIKIIMMEVAIRKCTKLMVFKIKQQQSEWNCQSVK